MRNGFLISVTTLLAGAGLAAAQVSPYNLKSPAGTAAPDPVPATPAYAPALDHAAGCAAPACCGPDVCGDPCQRYWVNVEYLLWWIKDNPVPFLITTGPAASAGILGRPTTVPVVGDGGIDNDVRSGGRFSAGSWINDRHTVGVESSFFFLGERTTDLRGGGTGAPGTPVLARPFFNVVRNAEDSQLIAFPGLVAGRYDVSVTSKLWGTEMNGLVNVACGDNFRLDALAGFRYFQLDEDLAISENLAVNGLVPVTGGSTFTLFDQFDVRNRFYGGNLGARAEYRWGRLFVNTTGKVALGGVDQEVRIDGRTQITPPNSAVTTVRRGGLLALTNLGRFNRTEFAVLPEITFNIGYQITRHVRGFLGYNFLYISDVVRPGDQIDRAVNPTLVPALGGTGALVGPVRPLFAFRDTDFWAQGVNFGFEVRY